MNPEGIPFEFPDRVFPGQLICPEYEVKQQDEVDLVFKFNSGQGTRFQSFEYDGTTVNAITATLVGNVKITETTCDSTANADQKASEEKLQSQGEVRKRIVKDMVVSVAQNDISETKCNVNDDFANNLPKEGDIVLTRVTRISLQRANVEILAVENQAVPVDSGIGSNGSGIVAAGGGSGAATFSIAQASSDLGETFRGLIRSQDVRATERDTVKIIDSFKPGDIVRAQVLSLGDGTNYYLTTARNDLGVVFARAVNGTGGLMYAIDWQTMAVPSTGATEKRKCAKPF